jgi:hypothetical protein
MLQKADNAASSRYTLQVEQGASQVKAVGVPARTNVTEPTRGRFRTTVDASRLQTTGAPAWR